ncbi:lipocalin family protein [Empedobacter falsenii]
MRNFILLFTLILFSTYSFGQKKIDQNLVGFWSSTIPKTKADPIDGKWLINRKNDGTFILYFELLNGRDSIYAKETGTWWTDNNQYFEEGDELNFNDVYLYKINENKIEYRLEKGKLPRGFKTTKYSEEKSNNLTDYYEEKYSVYKAKTMKKIFDMESSVDGFAYDQTDGEADERFVGVWTGSEKDNQVKGLSKEWAMTRNADGTFVLDFKTKMKGNKVKSHIEKGKWWVKDNKFYEYHEDSESTDVYEFQILNENQIKFKAFNMAFEQQNETYEFIDTRKK